MNISGNTVLITGGASGIGLALAERFLKAGNEVIICGRREEKLEEAKENFPQLHTRICDVSDAGDRQSLFDWVTKEFPDCNILVNNAGIQQRINLLNANQGWDYYQKEISTNLDAPIHLAMLFVPHFSTKTSATIINISSGLAITPAAWAPVYSGTKAALHAFTMTLRLQLAPTNVRVVEVFPPAVNTDLGGVGLHTFGAPVNDFADSIFAGIKQDDLEIFYGGTDQRVNATKAEAEQMIQQLWDNFVKNNPEFTKQA